MSLKRLNTSKLFLCAIMFLKKCRILPQNVLECSSILSHVFLYLRCTLDLLVCCQASTWAASYGTRETPCTPSRRRHATSPSASTGEQQGWRNRTRESYSCVISVPAGLGKGQGAKEIGQNLAREQPKFGHNSVLWAIDENMGTNLQAFYKHFYIGCLKTQNQQLHFVKIIFFFLN